MSEPRFTGPQLVAMLEEHRKDRAERAKQLEDELYGFIGKYRDQQKKIADLEAENAELHEELRALRLAVYVTSGLVQDEEEGVS